MKRTIIVVLMMVSAVALFANGGQETGPVWNPVEISGTVSLVDDYPVLTSGRETYLLGAPRAAWYVDAIDGGLEVTIRGHLVEDPVTDVAIETDGHIFVEQALVDGEVYPIGGRGGFAPSGRPPMAHEPPFRDRPAEPYTGRGPSAGPGSRGRW